MEMLFTNEPINRRAITFREMQCKHERNLRNVIMPHTVRAELGLLMFLVTEMSMHPKYLTGYT